MTFEEWLPTFSSDNYITTADIKEIWNAAIEAAITHLEQGNYYWPKAEREMDYLGFAEDELKKALDKLTYSVVQ